jgi:hypothetical protein
MGFLSLCMHGCLIGTATCALGASDVWLLSTRVGIVIGGTTTGEIQIRADCSGSLRWSPASGERESAPGCRPRFSRRQSSRAIRFSPAKKSATIRRNPPEPVFPFRVSPRSRIVSAPFPKGDATQRPEVVTSCKVPKDSSPPANETPV